MTMPAGNYWIGDLCYALSDEDWEEVCELTISPEGDCLEGEFEFKDGRRFAMYSTAYGDGIYKDQNGFEYPVDSGTLGCILLKDSFDPAVADSESGRVVNFDSDFETESTGRFVIIGNVRIDTDVPDEDY